MRIGVEALARVSVVWSRVCCLRGGEEEEEVWYLARCWCWLPPSSEPQRREILWPCFLTYFPGARPLFHWCVLWVNQLVLRPPHNRLPTSHLTTTAAKLSISLKLPAAAPPHTKKTPMPYQRRRAVLVFDAIKIMRAVVLPAALASYPAVKFDLLPGSFTWWCFCLIMFVF